MTAPSGRLRVLAVMPALTPEAGAETSLAAVAPSLVAAGVELHVACLTSVQTLVPAMRAAGATMHDLSGHRRLTGRVRSLRRLVRQLDVDLIHATLHEATLPAQLVAALTRRRILVTWANTPVLRGENPRIGSVKRVAVRLLDVVLAKLSRARFHAVTEGVARAGARQCLVPASRVRVAERGRDPRKFVARPAEELANLRRELGLADGQRLVLTVGRQDRMKGHVRLLDAFESVAGEHPEVVLAIAGREGSATPDIATRLATMRHRDRVRLLGHRNDVPSLLQVADVAVCSSFREGAAGALIEAMASGTPIVTTRVDGLDGVLVDGENALVVDAADLADAIRAVLEDGVAARSRAVRAHADFEARFTVERSAAALADVYRWAAG